MAWMTDDQKQMAAELELEYGLADRAMLEKTGEPYGLLWLRWHNASISEQFPDRNLFVKPDGSRLTWTLI